MATDHDSFQVTDRYLKYVVILIWFVLLLRFVDLQVIAVLLESIKAEFHFSDTELGVLSGIAFALFYATLGIPIAWMADRYNRRNIIAVSLGLWSLMSALCGTAVGFATLFLARIGVGIGEAGGIPPSYSLISDYISRVKRGTVFAILNSSIPAGVFVGFIVGGWVNQYFGWRAAFVVVGLPGIFLALLIRFTLREPPRGYADGQREVTITPPLKETLTYLWSLRSYRHIVLATSIFTTGAIGSGIWIPSFFIRVHHMTVAEIGTWLAFIYGIGGAIGSTLGGWLADRLVRTRGDARWYMWICGITNVCILPFSFFVYLWPNPVQALLVQLGTTTLMHMYLGPAFGTVQSLAGARRRAMASAINLFMINLIAMGLGPLIIGMASDYFNARFGDNALRYSILAVVIIAYDWAAIHFFTAARTLRQDLETAETSG
ncbi:MAG: MFS transporter [Gammaproteobacteria bacterium]|jgi:MFS family permease